MVGELQSSLEYKILNLAFVVGTVSAKDPLENVEEDDDDQFNIILLYGRGLNCVDLYLLVVTNTVNVVLINCTKENGFPDDLAFRAFAFEEIPHDKFYQRHKTYSQ